MSHNHLQQHLCFCCIIKRGRLILICLLRKHWTAERWGRRKGQSSYVALPLSSEMKLSMEFGENDQKPHTLPHLPQDVRFLYLFGSAVPYSSLLPGMLALHLPALPLVWFYSTFLANGWKKEDFFRFSSTDFKAHPCHLKSFIQNALVIFYYSYF